MAPRGEGLRADPHRGLQQRVIPARRMQAQGHAQPLPRVDVVVRLRGCDGTWCKVATSSVSGFVRQERLWGVYPGEKID